MKAIQKMAILGALSLTAADTETDVYSTLLKKPYDMSSCEGQPRGCTKMVKVLQNYDKEVTELKTKIAKLEGQGKKKSKPDRNAPEKTGKPIELTDATFSDYVKGSEDPSFVLFYAPWCGHCKSMMPDFNKLAGLMQEKTMNIIKVDCTENEKLARQFKIQGFPTLLFFPKGGKPKKYQMGRDLDSFQQFLTPYAKDSSVEPVKLNQLLNQQQFEASCAESPCIVTILPHLMDGGQAEGRAAAISTIEKAMNLDRSVLKKHHLFWMEAGTNIEWEEAIIGSVGYPVTFGIDTMKKSVGIFTKSNAKEKELAEFFKKFTKGMTPMAQYRNETLPQLAPMPVWDGKDFVQDEL